jgi:signal recognition particle receptor subunit beta
MRWLYLVAALIAALIVAFANEAISNFLRKHSSVGALALFVVVPLAAFLTRPLVIVERNRSQRAIGLVYALRRRRIGFIFGSIGLWLLATVLVLAAILLLYREAEIRAAAAVSNWWYVTNALVLVAHLVPGHFRLPATRPITIVVTGAKRSGKTTLIALLPIDAPPRGWAVTPTASATRLTTQLHDRARGAGEIQSLNETPRYMFLRERMWSEYAGVRPIPVDFVELKLFDAHQVSSSGRVGVLLMVESMLAPEAARAEAMRQLNAVRIAPGLAARDGRIRVPVAVVFSKSDLAPVPVVLPSAEVTVLLDQNCRRWRAFSASDRAGASDDTEVEGFNPKGFMDATLWLIAAIA